MPVPVTNEKPDNDIDCQHRIYGQTCCASRAGCLKVSASRIIKETDLFLLNSALDGLKEGAKYLQRD